MSDLPFYFTKLLSIITVTLCYFVVLAAGSLLLSKIFPSDDKEDIKTTFLLFMA